MKRSLSPTRREFLATAATLALTPRALLAQSSPLASDPRRPKFHLLPAKNWMNDPNGPIFFNGKYHMFFQYNPHAATWGDMSWYHSTSPDMLHWTHAPLAFAPTPGSPDAFGCFSGSALAVGKRVYQVYTGVVESTPDKATIRDGSDKLQESQCLAYSDDPQLIHWTKLPQPIVPLPPAGMAITGFRDPSAWKQGDTYYMTVGSGIARVGGCVLLYRSKDLKTWEYLHPLTSGTWNGKKTPNPCDDGEMWECPEFFALDGMHVLIYSTLGKVFWQSGKLDVATMKFTPTKTGLLDLDAFYAPKTQLDAQGRRILWGWIPERRNDKAMLEAGWSGMMSLPRVMRLDSDGTLRLQSLPEAAKLRAGTVPAEKTREGTLHTLPAANGEVLCRASSGKNFELSISTGTTELMHIAYSSARHAFLADGHEIALQPGDLPRLHAFVDGSVIELIVSERIGYTKRFYYEGSTAPDIHVHTTGLGEVTVDAWKIRPISINRLTT
ncbi:beta-fructofuranosidase [Granulicella pectinivorans]|jgi:beta-fructofuranosidase|uniref:beta-fructofuranosidase n=1 Tax=Granulicella pectinivorans TaxID=474950 RepID=A0A1I6M9J7_9BACT|nr:glycoside hydrolase family 32 protein [Granulicella pectinivorans]SFS12396.1 beta-fructofuranosidase [Granulicella pectinivorans]